jgi:hypothetical protein
MRIIAVKDWDKAHPVLTEFADCLICLKVGEEYVLRITEKPFRSMSFIDKVMSVPGDSPCVAFEDRDHKTLEEVFASEWFSYDDIRIAMKLKGWEWDWINFDVIDPESRWTTIGFVNRYRGKDKAGPQCCTWNDRRFCFDPFGWEWSVRTSPNETKWVVSLRIAQDLSQEKDGSAFMQSVDLQVMSFERHLIRGWINAIVDQMK